MAAILNCLGILREAKAGSEQVGRARMMLERQAHHLIRLIDDLLDVTRISQGKIQLRLECLDLCDIVRACIDDHAVALDKRGLALAVDVPTEPIWVHADRTRLSQVVSNLLSNAIKFTDPPGEVMVEAAVLPDEGQAMVCVSDTGIGVQPAFLTQLFEPFWQSADTLDRGTGGLGLGLALVKSLVYLHGGAVDARSDGLGKGTSVAIRIPLDDEAELTPVPGNGFGGPSPPDAA